MYLFKTVQDYSNFLQHLDGADLGTVVHAVVTFVAASSIAGCAGVARALLAPRKQAATSLACLPGEDNPRDADRLALNFEALLLNVHHGSFQAAAVVTTRAADAATVGQATEADLGAGLVRSRDRDRHRYPSEVGE